MRCFCCVRSKKIKSFATTVAATVVVLSFAAVTGGPEVIEFIKRFLLRKQQVELLSDEDQLDLNVHYVIPNNVFYIWCGANRYFEFRHYLSVLSAFRFIKPDRVVFYYEHEPMLDRERYYSWFWELKEQFIFFNLERVPTEWCKNKLEAIDQQLFRNGGVYIEEDTVLALFDQRFRLFDYAIVKDRYSKQLMRMSRRHYHINFDAMSADCYIMPVYLIEGHINISNNRRERGTIEFMTTNYTTDLLRSRSNERTLAAVAKFSVNPAAVWALESHTGRLFRTVMYQKSEVVHAVSHYDHLAPNIAHVVWINNGSMSFQFFLCVLSLVEVAKVDRVYIHGDSPPTGFYWNLIEGHPKIKTVYRTLFDNRYEKIYGKNVTGNEYISDIWRLQILYRYGGLYVDSDVLFYRPLTREIRAYDAVISKNILTNTVFPDTYSNGVMIGKPGARFWLLLMEYMKQFSDCCLRPYKIKERHPELVHEDVHLQVICSNARCFPTWMKSYKDKNSHHLQTGSMANWLNDSYAVHHTALELPELSSHQGLLRNNGSTLFGEIALYILKQAGKLEYFQKLLTAESKSFESSMDSN